MRIGVNAVPLRVSGGGARYVFTELLERLLALDPENDYTIFAHFLGLSVVNRLPQVHAHLSAAVPGRRPRVVEVGCEEDIFQFRDDFDLFFGPLNNLQPRIYDRPSVAILHDIQEQYFPQYFSPSDLRARHEIYPEISKSATILVTISEFCKQSIVEKFGVEADKIEVVYNAPQSRLVARAAADRGVWRRGPLPERFLFYPANCYLHKNHALLLDALVALRAARRDCPGAVFTGFELPGGFALRAEIAKRGLDDLCQVHAEVHVDELRHLYTHATALVMPTLFEGFGMPAVEALACGCPVICSDLPPLHEVAGAAALYFKPNDQAGLRRQIERVLDDAVERERLVAQGRTAAARFSWDTSAQRMLALFDEAPRRFLGARGGVSSAEERGPRIGLVIATDGGGYGVPEALKDIWHTGYRNVVVRVDVPQGPGSEEVSAFLKSAEIPYEVTPARPITDWARLERFAAEEGLDLVGVLVAGHNHLLATALHSLAWGYQQFPERAVYLGEVWEREGARMARTARMRLLDTGDWKLENFLYPEMVFVAPQRLAAWTAGRESVRAAGIEWRWELVKAGRRDGQLALLRRTLAICDPGCISLMHRYRAARAGADAVYAANGTKRGNGLMGSLKPVLRPVSRLLPGGLREKGKRIWKHLANES